MRRGELREAHSRIVQDSRDSDLQNRYEGRVGRAGWPVQIRQGGQSPKGRRLLVRRSQGLGSRRGCAQRSNGVFEEAMRQTRHHRLIFAFA